MFSDAGLDVVLRPYPTGKMALGAMFAGEVDVATVAETPVMFNSFTRNDFAVIATFTSSNDDCKVIARGTRAIENSFETGTVYHNVEAALPFEVADEVAEGHFLQSTSRIVVRERTMVLISLMDITQQKRAEEQVRTINADLERLVQNLRRMATVVRDSNDAITIQDFEGRITAWNRGAELMYGYSEAEALLMNIELLTIPGKVAEQKEFIRRLVAGEAITSFETQRVTKDGRVLDVWMTVTKLMDAQFPRRHVPGRSADRRRPAGDSRSRPRSVSNRAHRGRGFGRHGCAAPARGGAGVGESE